MFFFLFLFFAKSLNRTVYKIKRNDLADEEEIPKIPIPHYLTEPGLENLGPYYGDCREDLLYFVPEPEYVNYAGYDVPVGIFCIKSDLYVYVPEEKENYKIVLVSMSDVIIMGIIAGVILVVLIISCCTINHQCS